MQDEKQNHQIEARCAQDTIFKALFSPNHPEFAFLTIRTPRYTTEPLKK